MKPEDTITIHYQDGQVNATVQEVEEGE